MLHQLVWLSSTKDLASWGAFFYFLQPLKSHIQYWKGEYDIRKRVDSAVCASFFGMNAKRYPIRFKEQEQSHSLHRFYFPFLNMLVNLLNIISGYFFISFSFYPWHVLSCIFREVHSFSFSLPFHEHVFYFFNAHKVLHLTGVLSMTFIEYIDNN